MTETELLARDIYLRVIKERMLSQGPKAWDVDPKQAKRIARASFDAAAVFMEESLAQQSAGPVPAT